MKKDGSSGSGAPVRPDLSLLLSSANRCHYPDGSLATDHYLCIMHELVKLLGSLYPGLPAALHHCQRSLRQLEIYRVSGASCYYGNIHLMVDHEMSSITCRGRKSGSHSLYSLNLALGFAVQFLDALHQRELHSRRFSAADRIEIYQATVGQHRSRVSQLPCRLMLARCPGRRGLMKGFSQCCHGDQSQVELLRSVVDSLGQIHTEVEHLLIRMDFSPGGSTY